MIDPSKLITKITVRENRRFSFLQKNVADDAIDAERAEGGAKHAALYVQR